MGKLEQITGRFIELTRRYSFAITVFLLLLALIPLFNTWSLLFELSIWRHDAMYYYDSYLEKFQGEGRWINYILFDTLRQIKPMPALFMQVFCLGFFVENAAFKLCRDRLYSLMVALLAVSAVPLYIQLLWPVTTIPAFFILAMAAVLSRKLPALVYFPLLGSLFFGTMGHLYFLLPLLYLHKFVDDGIAVGEKAVLFLRSIFFPWLMGYVFGFLVANLFVFIITGQYGLELDSWRRPNPIVGWDSWVANLHSSLAYLMNDATYLFAMVGLCLSALIVSLFVTRQWQRRDSFYLLLPLLIILSLYVSVIPYGVVLSFRSSFGLWLGTIFLFLVVSRMTRLERPVYALVCLILLVLSAGQNIDNLNWYGKSTAFYRSELVRVIDNPPENYQGIVLLSGSRQFSLAEQRLNRLLGLTPHYGAGTLAGPLRWAPVAKELGFRRIHRCEGKINSGRCAKGATLIKNLGEVDPNSLYKTAVSPSGWLVVSLNERFVDNPNLI